MSNAAVIFQGSETVNKLLKECIVNKQGLLVVSSFDPKILRQIEKIVVPQQYLYSVLCILHTKLLHPTNHQLMSVFVKYFYASNLARTIETIKDICDTCISVAKLPKDFSAMEPNKVPLHPGSHVNIDIIRRANQKIIVCADMFSAFTTAAFVEGETREILEHAIVQVITPMRHSPKILARTDNAPAFKSLCRSTSPILQENGITLQLGNDANKNANAIVDKIIQELEFEIKKLAPNEEKLSAGRLGHALTILNTRVRSSGLTASELHFSRDPIRGINLHLNDEDIAKNKTEARKTANYSAQSRHHEPKTKSISTGDTVVITQEGSKHQARAPHLVTNVENDNVTVTKIMNSNQTQQKLPNWSPYQRVIHKKLLTIRRKAPVPQIQDQESSPISLPSPKIPDWYPTIDLAQSESDYSSDEDEIICSHSAPLKPPDHGNSSCDTSPEKHSVDDQPPTLQVTDDNLHAPELDQSFLGIE